MTLAPERPTDATHPGADTNSYRSLLTFAAEDCALDRIREQLSSWLRQRHLEVDLTQSRLYATDGRELAVVHHESAAGRDFRARLVESNPSGRWTTELTTHVPPKGNGWLALNVSNDRNRPADVPRLAGYLLDVLETFDGELALSSAAPVIHTDGVEHLLDALCDPDRHGLILVAGTDDELPFAPFVQRVRDWTRNIRGLGQAVVLDPHATAQFADLLGSTHAVAPWTVRTFYPEVDPAWPADARRHKILGTQRLASEPDHVIRALLGRIARRHAAERIVPAGATRVFRDLARIEDRLLVDALLTPSPDPAPTPVDEAPTAPPTSRSGDSEEAATQTAPSQGDESAAGPPTQPTKPTTERPGDIAEQASTYLAQVELAKQLLGVDDLRPDTLTEIASLAGRARRDADALDRITRELAARQERIAALEDEVAFHKELYNEEEFYRVVAEDERSRAEDEARWLRRELHKAGNHVAATATVPEDSITRYPESFDGLLDRLPELEPLGVVFTGQPELARGLDDVDGNSKIVRATWESLLVLTDYVHARAAGDHDGGVHAYLERTPSGYRPMSPKKHAWKESTATMNQWGGERMLPVPPEVDPSGHACMEAHFKLGRVGMVSPRMHYHDDWSRSGKVYVGYIGPHLTTTGTN